MNKPIPDFVKQAQAELGAYGQVPIVNAELCAVTTIELIGLLQLASRHPQLPLRQREVARDLVDMLSKAFKPEHVGIARLIKEGWNQEFDRELSA